MPTTDHLRRSAAAKRPRSTLGRLLASIGPGFITGAADDDPAGIVTDIQAGAQFQYGFAWTALIQLPLLAAVQIMVARLGLVTGLDFPRAIREYYSPRLLWAACLLLIVANTITAGADLAGAASAVELIFGISRYWVVPVLTVGLPVVLVFGRYVAIARTMKWFALALFAYVIASILAHPDWSAVLRGTFTPSFSGSSAYLSLFVAVFGGTISPYMLVWQSSQEVEELRAAHKRPLEDRPRAAFKELRVMLYDTILGMGVSQVIEYSAFVAAGAIIFPTGVRDIETARQAAVALKPIGSGLGEVLFSIGLFGSGLLAAATLTGSSAYTLAAAAKWRTGINKTRRQAPQFYTVLVIGTLIAGAIAMASRHPMPMLVASQVINGILAPPLLIILLRVSNNKRIVGSHTNGMVLNGLCVTAILLMGVPALWLLVLTARGG